MGQTQTAWVAADGSVVQEEGLLGFSLKRVTQAQALAAVDVSPDLTRWVAVAVNRQLDDPASLEWLSLAVGGLNRPLRLDGGRQAYNHGRLNVQREVLPSIQAQPDPQQAAFLAATPLIEADHPDVRAAAAAIVSPQDPPVTRVHKIMEWVYYYIEKRPVLSVPSALETLRQGVGDCNEHAVVFAALARAAGIPAQVEAGLVYMDGRFYYHAWNVVNLGVWITVDALMNQFPADVTHIRLVRGEPAEQIDLMRVIGKLSLEVLEAR
jgi:transglutaminase-like putative cysteine protease